MPNVAFDPSIILKPNLPARSAPERDGPAFESLLDSAPPAADNRPAPDYRAADLAADRAAARADRDDRSARTDQAQANREPNRSNDAKSAQASDSNASDRTATDNKASDNKTSDSTASGDTAKAGDAATKAKAPADKADSDKSDTKTDAKPDADAKAADLTGQTPTTVDVKTADTAIPTGAQAAIAATIPTLTPADALTTAAVPATLEAGTEKAAIEAAGDGTAGADGKAKSDKPAAAKTADGKAADGAKDGAGTKAATAQTGTQTDPETGTPTDKVAASPDKTEKADAHARGETPAKDIGAAKLGAADKPAFDPALAAPNGGVDATQTAAMTARTQQATPAAAAAAAPAASVAQPATAAIPLSGVAFEITSKALTSTNHFEIRLDPPDLGRIEVRLDVDKDGNVTSNMIVDRPETLDLLRRDASGLDRALQDAGLKTSNNGLQFQLRDQSNNQQQGGGSSHTARLVVQDEAVPSPAIARDYGRLIGNSGGVDIHV